jgi:hypothetical protein
MGLKTNARYTNKEKFSVTFLGPFFTVIVLDAQKAEDLPMYQGLTLHDLQMETLSSKLIFFVGVKALIFFCKSS